MREDIIGRWSEEKLQLLEKYIQAYARIMNSQKKTGKKWLKAFRYIDAFAGSGQAKAKDEERYIEGSPLRALRCEIPFDSYWFIETSPWRVERLQALQKQFSNRQIIIRQGDCNDILCNEVVTKITYASRQRGLVFLDPYGLHIAWETVRSLAGTRTFDLFVNFPLMAITRLLKVDGPPKGQALELLNKVMGNTDWIQTIYKPSNQMMLFGDHVVARDVMRAEWLAQAYVDQIIKLFPLVSDPVIMTNSKNAPLYALFLASHNEKAVRIVNDIFSLYNRLRETK